MQTLNSVKHRICDEVGEFWRQIFLAAVMLNISPAFFVTRKKNVRACS